MKNDVIHSLPSVVSPPNKRTVSHNNNNNKQGPNRDEELFTTMSSSSSSSSSTTRTIVITGGLGNLGTKLCNHLLDQNNNNNDDDGNKKYEVILLEHPAFIKDKRPHNNSGAILVPCDLGNPSACHKELLQILQQDVDVLVHFSAVNPYPNATWSESAQSMDHTFTIFQLAVLCKVRRVILASSNHVMGGYKDDSNYGPSSIHPDSDPKVGTIPLDRNQIATGGDAIAYGTAKLAGERLARTLGQLYSDTTTFVVLRIGWCQPGENKPSTLSAAGSPPEFLTTKEEEVAAEVVVDTSSDEIWFKQMWLSNRDFLNYFEAAIDLTVPTTDNNKDDDENTSVHRHVQKGFVLLNAMSRNHNAKWNLEKTEQWLGVVSKDDSLAEDHQNS